MYFSKNKPNEKREKKSSAILLPFFSFLSPLFSFMPLLFSKQEYCF